MGIAQDCVNIVNQKKAFACQSLCLQDSEEVSSIESQSSSSSFLAPRVCRPLNSHQVDPAGLIAFQHNCFEMISRSVQMHNSLLPPHTHLFVTPRLAAEEPQVIHEASEANQLRHWRLSREPPLPLARPPKMYSPSAASDHAAVW